jgi:hypothetical protein
MRAALRVLLWLAISLSLTLAAIPTKATAAQVKVGCCAFMKMDQQMNDCDQHAPKPNEDQQCCSMCVFCLAVLPVTTAFVYPQTGDESFASLSVHERSRSDRPPVPPPRA